MTPRERVEEAGGIELSVVIPVFNEEETAGALVEQLDAVLSGEPIPYEMVLVDDGSRDATPRILGELRALHPRLRVLRMSRNFGQTLAMQAGIDAARGRVVVTMDGDLQNDPRDIPRLLAKIAEGYDVVSGWRRRRKDNPVLRTAPSRVANWIIGRLSGVRLHDTGCSLKAYRAANLRGVRLYADMHRFIPAIVSISGARIAEVEVDHHPRRAGRSKYGVSRIFKVALDLAVIKMITGFSARPGRYFALLGLPWFVAGAAVLWAGLSGGEGPVTIVMPAASLLLFFLGMHFLLLSFLGELLLATGAFRPDEVVEEGKI
jgi:glycosyltransferase involved in cell wall biosynthesis